LSESQAPPGRSTVSPISQETHKCSFSQPDTSDCSASGQGGASAREGGRWTPTPEHRDGGHVGGSSSYTPPTPLGPWGQHHSRVCKNQGSARRRVCTDGASTLSRGVLDMTCGLHGRGVCTDPGSAEVCTQADAPRVCCTP
jgi:hypothetical protein